MKYTNNHHFPQWEESDRVLMTDFNKMCSDMETELDKVKDDAAAGRQAIQQTIQNIQKDLGGNGKNARMVFGTYTGTGVYGQDHPNRLKPGFFPVLGFIIGGQLITIFGRGCKSAYSLSGAELHVEWTDTEIIWYTYKDDSLLPGHMQNNAPGTIYPYYVFGYEK